MNTPRTFRYTEDAGVATITLDRPDRLNALTFEVYAELRDLFSTLAHRDEVKVIIITGEGRGFCSGGDVEDIVKNKNLTVCVRARTDTNHRHLQFLRDLRAELRRNAFEQNDVRANGFKRLGVFHHLFCGRLFATLYTEAADLVH